MNIVILAFGPTKTTTAAIRRGRRLAGASAAIVVVPATTLGRSVKVTGAGTTKTNGSSGLGEALEGMEGPTLLIHDDAALGSRALAGLSSEFERHRAIMVPGTNDVGSDHFVGVLPPAEGAETALARMRSPHAGAELRRIIPTVLFGSAHDLADLIDSRIVDPRTTLTATTMRFVASTVVATHNGTCRQRLHAPAAPDGRPLLVASMIVRDEEETLEDCLASLSGLVDRIDLVDTGSTDATIDIARRHGAEVSTIEWRDDFGWARNQALERSRDAHFVLHIDADERVVCPDPIEFRRFLATFGEEYQAFQPRIVNYHDLERRAVTSEFRATRIFTTSDTAFLGAIHESPVLVSKGEVSIPTSPLDMLWIDHIGYSQHFVGTRNKAERNVRIAAADVDTDQNFRTLFHYARSLQLSDPTNPAIADYFQRSLTFGEQANEQSRAHAYGSMAGYRLQEGDVEGALSLANQGAELVPADEVCAVAACEALARLGRDREILEVLERRRVGGPIPPLFSTEHLSRTLDSHEVAALAAVGRFDEAYAKASTLLQRAPGAFQHWGPLIKSARAAGVDHVELLARLAVFDPSGSFDRIIATNLDAATTAAFAVRYFELGGAHAQVAATGILTAIVSDDPDTALVLTTPAHRLEPAVIRKLASMADDRGFPEIADALIELAVA
ncbi:MAG: glycosyltransferase [Acidimicrobiia bacterium]